MKTPSLHALLAAILVLSSCTALADDPKLPPPQKDTLQAVLDRIHQHAAGEAWKQPGFQDDAIEAWLDKLVGSIAKAADIPDLKLPVRLKDVQPGEPQPDARGVPTLTGGLVVAKDLDWETANVQGSVILADGDVELSRADKSVIVARGAITIHGYSSNCVMAAGTLATVAVDGMAVNGVAGSIIVSRGWVTLGNRAYGTIVAAHQGVFTSDTRDALFINSPAAKPADLASGFGTRGAAAFGARGGAGFGAPVPARDTGSRIIQAPDLPLEALRLHPLGAKLKVLGVMHGDAPPVPRGAPRAIALPSLALSRGLRPNSVIFQYEGRRYFADLGQPIADEAGDPLAALRGWKLTYLADKLAILCGPEGVTVLRMDEK